MNRSLVDEIKERISITDIISRYVKLTNAGKQMKGLCPFHSEKSPSFYVNPDNQYWKCFGCGLGGDVINFVEQVEKCSFIEALESLASQSGIDMSMHRNSSVSSSVSNETTTLFAVLQDCAKMYTQCLQLPQYSFALDYLTSRGVTATSREDFGIGFAPDNWSTVTSQLEKKYGANQCLQSGIAIQGSKGIYDRFRSRIMFPTYDIRDRVVTFSGRIYSEQGVYITERDTSGKYINGPETPVYKKSKTLYGLSRARVAIAKKQRVILVEGHLDCIMAHQSGYTETVALAGTALTQDHIDILLRFTSEIILCLDADTAGISAMAKSIPLLYKSGFHVLVATLPVGSDPADLILHSTASFTTAIESSTHFVESRLKYAQLDNASISTIDSILKHEIYPVVSMIHNPLYRDESIKTIARYTGMSYETVIEHSNSAIAIDQQTEALVHNDKKNIDQYMRLAAVWSELLVDYPAEDVLIAEYISEITEKKINSLSDFCEQYAIIRDELPAYYIWHYHELSPDSVAHLAVQEYCKFILDSIEKKDLESSYRNRGPTDEQYIQHITSYTRRYSLMKHTPYAITTQKIEH